MLISRRLFLATIPTFLAPTIIAIPTSAQVDALLLAGLIEAGKAILGGVASDQFLQLFGWDTPTQTTQKVAQIVQAAVAEIERYIDAQLIRHEIKILKGRMEGASHMLVEYANAGRLDRLDGAARELDLIIHELDQFGANSFFVFPFAVTLKLTAIIEEYRRTKHQGEVTNYEQLIEFADNRLIQWRDDIEKSMLAREQSLTELQTWTWRAAPPVAGNPNGNPNFGLIAHVQFSYLGKVISEESGFPHFDLEITNTDAYKSVNSQRNHIIATLKEDRRKFEEDYLPAMYKLRQAWASAGSNAMGSRTWGVPPIFEPRVFPLLPAECHFFWFRMC